MGIPKSRSSFWFLNKNSLAQRSITNSWIIPRGFLYFDCMVYTRYAHKIEGDSILIIECLILEWVFYSFYFTLSLDHNPIQIYRVIIIRRKNSLILPLRWNGSFIGILLDLTEIQSDSNSSYWFLSKRNNLGGGSASFFFRTSLFLCHFVLYNFFILFVGLFSH